MRTTSSVIVGREDEIGLLSGALNAAGQRSGRAVFLIGEAGIGKSRLVGECAYQAYGFGLPVLRGRATSTGLVVPFRPLIEALSSRFRATGPPTDPELDPYRPALARLVPEWRGSVPPGYPETVIELAEALLRLLAVLGREQGCVLLLEDLHDTDTETVAVVEYLVDNVADLPVLLVGTLRPEPGPALDLVRATEQRQTATVSELRPLGPESVREMTAICLETHPDELPQVVHRRLTERAGGNPYLVEVLLADMLDSGALRKTDGRWGASDDLIAGVPTTIVRSWARRIDQLDDQVRDLLLTAATLGNQFSVAVLQLITGHDDRTLFSHLRSAVEANVIVPDGAAPDRYTFRHALTAEALIASLAPAERAAVARRAALAIEEGDPDPTDDRRQLVAALRLAAGDRAGAALQYAEAGRRTLAAGAFNSAVVLLERAHGLAADADRPAVSESLLVAQAESGELDRAFALAATLSPVRPGTETAERRIELHTRLAWAAVMAERGPEALLQVRTVQALLGAEPRPEQRAALAVVEGHLALLPGEGGREQLADAYRTARRAAEIAEDRGLPVVACQAWQLLALLSRERGFDEADACLERMLAVAESHALPVWRVEALLRLGANAFMRSGDATRLEAAREAAGALGAIVLTQTVDGMLAMNAIMRGRWDTARDIIGRSLEASARLRNLAAHRYLLLASATLAAHRGRRRDMERELARFRQVGGEESFLVPLQLGLCRGVGALLDEDADRARTELAAALAWEERHPSFFYLSGRYGLYPLLAVLAGDAGREEYEAAVAAPAAALAWNQQFLRLTEAVLLGREGDHEGAVRAVRAAGRTAETFPLAHHLGLRLVADAALLQGWGDPVAWLRTAEEFFYAAEIQPVAGACRASLRQAGVSVAQHRGGWDRIPAPLRTHGVTPREYEVFVLLADRPGNQQIAQRLCISPRTVEKHMASLLGKTGRSDRAALCALSAELAAELATGSG
ncbi:helix-turn-helix transcriptional regulator [Streptomyces sp. DT171]|uniref:helix-turn-helix transcriptional regulator n=1 Tax=Streptomyces sp. DT171 TaxID=3416524 RepID=UPI003CF9FCDF